MILKTVLCASRRIVTALLAALIVGNATAAPPACYADIPSFMVETFGAAYKDDENLIVKETRYGNRLFMMVVDLTPGTNVIRTLLSKTTQGRYCVVLTTAPMAQLKVARTNKSGDPVEFRASDQAPGTQAGNEITYVLGRSNTYQPVRCKKIRFRGTVPVKTPVPCSSTSHHE